jgi:thiamine biosynthesis lipoprotein
VVPIALDDDARRAHQDVVTTIFRAMDTDVSVLTPCLDPVDEGKLADQVRIVFEHAERVFSRFRPESELSLLNRASSPVVVSEELFFALQRAQTYWLQTDGRFDPTIAPALRAAGYERSFSADMFEPTPRTPAPRHRIGFQDVVLDVRTRSVTLPEGAAIDCGGFIKGWTVDQAIRLLPVPSMLSAGGDARFTGSGADGRGWLVSVEDPSNPGRSLLHLRAHDRAVATSGTNRRAWWMGDQRMHHLIDPRTGGPSLSDLAQVTVIADTTEQADVFAKAAFLRGLRDGRRFLTRFRGVAAVFVTRAGAVHTLGKLQFAARDPRDIFHEAVT